MPSGFLTPVLLLALLVVAFQVIYTANRDLYRARAWRELLRKALPLVMLVLMVATLPLVQTATAGWIPLTWALVLGLGVVLANFLSMPTLERRAGRHFRRGEYAQAANGFRELAEQKRLARYYAFLGAALGADRNGSGEGSSTADTGMQDSIDASTRAVELDPAYGVAYYNRALVNQKAGRKSKASKDMRRALEADLPRRFRNAARRHLEDG